MDRGEVLLAARRRKQMSQEHLASVAEVSVRTIRRAERGEDVSGESLRCLCAVLEIDAETLPRKADAPRSPSLPVLKAKGGIEHGTYSEISSQMLLLTLAFFAVCATPMSVAAITLLRDHVGSQAAPWFTLCQCLVLVASAIVLHDRMGQIPATILLGFGLVAGNVLWLINFGAGMPLIIQLAEISSMGAGILLIAGAIEMYGDDLRQAVE